MNFLHPFFLRVSLKRLRTTPVFQVELFLKQRTSVQTTLHLYIMTVTGTVFGYKGSPISTNALNKGKINE